MLSYHSDIRDASVRICDMWNWLALHIRAAHVYRNKQSIQQGKGAECGAINQSARDKDFTPSSQESGRVEVD
jgi:hypothetical protein